MRTNVLFFILCCLLNLAAHSQKIKVDEVDKFTKAHRVETNYVVLRMKMSCALQVSLRSVDTALFISMNGAECGAGAINDRDYLMFLLDDDSTVKFYSTGLQSYDIHAGGMLGPQKTYTHQYSISRMDLQKLKGRKVLSVRKTFNNSYDDFDIAEKYQENVSKLATLFSSRLN